MRYCTSYRRNEENLIENHTLIQEIHTETSSLKTSSTMSRNLKELEIEPSWIRLEDNLCVQWHSLLLSADPPWSAVFLGRKRCVDFRVSCCRIKYRIWEILNRRLSSKQFLPCGKRKENGKGVLPNINKTSQPTAPVATGRTLLIWAKATSGAQSSGDHFG